jgi:hypothetical protein
MSSSNASLTNRANKSKTKKPHQPTSSRSSLLGDRSDSEPEASSSAVSSSSTQFPQYVEENLAVINATTGQKKARVINRLNGYDLREIAEAEAAVKRAAEEDKLAQEKAKLPNFFQLLVNNAENRGALHTLIIVSVLLFIVPLAVFFFLSEVVFTNFSTDRKMLYSGIGAVVMVNFITVGFGIVAYYEPEEPESDAQLADRELRRRIAAEQWLKETTVGQKNEAAAEQQLKVMREQIQQLQQRIQDNDNNE